MNQLLKFMFNIMYGLSHLTSFYYFSIEWVGLLCLTPLSTIFQLYRGCHFHWCRKAEYAEKTTDRCGIFELFRQCGILELFRHCGILELFRQVWYFEMFRQCGIFELFRQCGILELFRQVWYF